MKTAIFASLLASAAAFAPASQKASSSALKAFEDELGAQPPLGFYDPAGMLNNASPARFERLREVESKCRNIDTLDKRICPFVVGTHLLTHTDASLFVSVDVQSSTDASPCLPLPDT